MSPPGQGGLGQPEPGAHVCHSLVKLVGCTVLSYKLMLHAFVAVLFSRVFQLPRYAKSEHTLALVSRATFLATEPPFI